MTGPLTARANAERKAVFYKWETPILIERTRER
jgi:hypothetical protein